MYRLNDQFSALSSEELYDQLISVLQRLHPDEIPSVGEEASYRITKVLKSTGVSFERVSTCTDWEIPKADWMAVLAFVKESGQTGFNTSTLKGAGLVFKTQSPTIAFLMASGLVS